MKSYPPVVATDPTDSYAYPLDFQTAHDKGIPHRSVHIEIENDKGEYFIWYRMDGRLEIPGGHVDWLEDQDRPESYEEAALREIVEELNLPQNWRVDRVTAQRRLKEHLSQVARLINQVPSSHGNNNEWVIVFRAIWQREWGDPRDPTWLLSGEGKSPRWLSLEEIEQRSLEIPMGINAALRLFLQRRGVLVPLIGPDTE